MLLTAGKRESDQGPSQLRIGCFFFLGPRVPQIERAPCARWSSGCDGLFGEIELEAGRGARSRCGARCLILWCRRGVRGLRQVVGWGGGLVVVARRGIGHGSPAARSGCAWNPAAVIAAKRFMDTVGWWPAGAAPLNPVRTMAGQGPTDQQRPSGQVEAEADREAAPVSLRTRMRPSDRLLSRLRLRLCWRLHRPCL